MPGLTDIPGSFVQIKMHLYAFIALVLLQRIFIALVLLQRAFIAIVFTETSLTLKKGEFWSTEEILQHVRLGVLLGWF